MCDMKSCWTKNERSEREKMSPISSHGHSFVRVNTINCSLLGHSRAQRPVNWVHPARKDRSSIWTVREFELDHQLADCGILIWFQNARRLVLEEAPDQVKC